MKNIVIQNIKENIQNINEQALIISTTNIIHCYENNTLDTSDLYNLARDVLELVSRITDIRQEIDTLA